MTSPTWIPTEPVSGFGVDNLPYGSVVLPDGRQQLVVRIGAHILRLDLLAESGLLAIDRVPADVYAAPDLTELLRQGRPAWDSTRRRLLELVDAGNTEVRDVPGLADRVVIPLTSVEQRLPFAVGDFVDMYSSIEHATNLGRLLRPDGDPLLPNWRHMPVGYHGRSASVVVSGTPITRPNGQRRPEPGADGPTFGPERMLDFELELGFVVGDGPAPGVPIHPDDAADYIFGFLLLNDWSAREIQRWEYQPLGPNLGKSFASTVSPWVVPMAALDALRRPNVPQDPRPLPHLRTDEPWAFDIELQVELRPAGGEPEVVSRGNARTVYWNPAQQLAHMTSNGARVRAGDLFGTGTISGRSQGSEGSMIELTRAGAEPLTLGATKRCFLEDGDTVVLRGIGTSDGIAVSLGEATGTIHPAPAL